MASLAGIVTGALLALVALAVLVIHPDPLYLRLTFTPEHVTHLNMYDSRGQQWAHRGLALALGLFGLAMWLRRPVRIPPFSAGISSIGARYGGIAILLAVLAWLLLRAETPALNFQGRYPLHAMPTVAMFALGLVIASAYALLADKNLMPRLALGAIAIYAGALIYFGIAQRPDLVPGLLSWFEWHYSGAVGPADRLAAGQRLGDVPVHSGLLPSVLLAIWQQAYGMLDFGGHIRVVAALQSAALVAALAGYGAWYSGRAAPWIAAGLLALPWMQPLHVAVLYPNQSAWRFFAFCLGAVLLVLLHARRLRFLGAILGFAGGAALLWSPETGVVLCLSYVTFLVLRGARVPELAEFVLGVAAAVGAFVLVGRAGLGYWPDLAATLASYPLIGDYGKGYGGLRFGALDPLALLVFVHLLYVLVRGLLEWGSGVALEPRAQCRVALATLAILWAAYYFARPDPWNLWSFLFLYGFFVGDLLPGRDPEGRPWTLRRMPGSPRLAAAALIVLPSILAMNALTLRALELAAGPSCPQERVVSGICVPAQTARALEEKAAALRAQAGRGSVLYFTTSSYLMPLMSGIVPPLRERDVYADTFLRADFGRLAARILELKPACLLFDDPKSALSGYHHHHSFYGRLRAAIAPAYERGQSAGGWEAWCLKST